MEVQVKKILQCLGVALAVMMAIAWSTTTSMAMEKATSNTQVMTQVATSEEGLVGTVLDNAEAVHSVAFEQATNDSLNTNGAVTMAMVNSDKSIDKQSADPVTQKATVTPFVANVGVANIANAGIVSKCYPNPFNREETAMMAGITPATNVMAISTSSVADDVDTNTETALGAHVVQLTPTAQSSLVFCDGASSSGTGAVV